jgi:WD40 repeat protein
MGYFNDEAGGEGGFLGGSAGGKDGDGERLKYVEIENLKQKDGLIWWEEFGKMCADRIERGIEKNS